MSGNLENSSKHTSDNSGEKGAIVSHDSGFHKEFNSGLDKGTNSNILKDTTASGKTAATLPEFSLYDSKAGAGGNPSSTGEGKVMQSGGVGNPSSGAADGSVGHLSSTYPPTDESRTPTSSGESNSTSPKATSDQASGTSTSTEAPRVANPLTTASDGSKAEQRPSSTQMTDKNGNPISPSDSNPNDQNISNDRAAGAAASAEAPRVANPVTTAPDGSKPEQRPSTTQMTDKNGNPIPSGDANPNNPKVSSDRAGSAANTAEAPRVANPITTAPDGSKVEHRPSTTLMTDKNGNPISAGMYGRTSPRVGNDNAN